MNEQLSLFEDENDELLENFHTIELDKNWNYYLSKEKCILRHFDKKMTNVQAKELVNRAIPEKTEREIFGYEIYYTEDGKNYKTFLRVINSTTRKRETVYEFLDRAFEENRELLDKLWRKSNEIKRY